MSLTPIKPDSFVHEDLKRDPHERVWTVSSILVLPIQCAHINLRSEGSEREEEKAGKERGGR